MICNLKCFLQSEHDTHVLEIQNRCSSRFIEFPVCSYVLLIVFLGDLLPERGWYRDTGGTVNK